FSWHEWVSGVQCAPSGTYLEDVKLEGALDNGVLKMTMSRDAVGFHAMRRCPGAKGLQLIELPEGELELALAAVPAASLEMPVESPLAGVHRFVLRDPRQIAQEQTPLLAPDQEAEMGNGLLVSVAGLRNGESGQFFVVAFRVRNPTSAPVQLAWDSA